MQSSVYPIDYGDTGAKASAPPEQKGVESLLGSDAGKIANEAMAWARSAENAVKEVRPFLDKSLTQQPMGTLAAIAALGFLLGAMWKK